MAGEGSKQRTRWFSWIVLMARSSASWSYCEFGRLEFASCSVTRFIQSLMTVNGHKKAPDQSPMGVESQRDSSIQPRVARHELPWVCRAKQYNPERVASLRARRRCNPVGVGNDLGWLPRVVRCAANPGLNDPIPLGLNPKPEIRKQPEIRNPKRVFRRPEKVRVNSPANPAWPAIASAAEGADRFVIAVHAASSVFYLSQHSRIMNIETIEDQEFGALRWEARCHEWVGKAAMEDGRQFELSVSTMSYHQKNNRDRSITMESRVTFRDIRRSDARVRSKIAEEFLGVYSVWHDGEIISAEDFQARLRLEGVRILPKGGAQMFYLDDGMFYGHSLIAHLEPGGSVSHTELFG